MAKQYNNISDEAVAAATGRAWDEWFALLDEAGAEQMSHKEIASRLIRDGHLLAADVWWAQAVTVAYEYARGRRVKGQTADAGFQVGVQKTLPVEASDLWTLLTSPAGLPLWLGNGVEDLVFEPGSEYHTADGTRGEIRTVYPAERIRLTWQPAAWEHSSTLQLYLQDKGDRTALRFHHEQLADASTRSEMRAHWQGVLRRINETLR